MNDGLPCERVALVVATQGIILVLLACFQLKTGNWGFEIPSQRPVILANATLCAWSFTHVTVLIGSEIEVDA